MKVNYLGGHPERHWGFWEDVTDSQGQYDIILCTPEPFSNNLGAAIGGIQKFGVPCRGRLHGLLAINEAHLIQSCLMKNGVLVSSITVTICVLINISLSWSYAGLHLTTWNLDPLWAIDALHSYSNMWCSGWAQTAAVCYIVSANKPIITSALQT